MMDISFAALGALDRERGTKQVSGPSAGTVMSGPIGAVASTVFAALLLALALTIATASPGRAADSAATAPQEAGAQGEPPAQQLVAASIGMADATTITRAGVFLLLAGGLAVAAIVRRTMLKVDTKQRRSRRRFEGDLPTVIAAARRAAPPYPLPYSPSDYAGAQARSNQEPEELDGTQRVIAREDGIPSWPLLKTHVGRAYGRAAGGTPPHIVLIWNDGATPRAFVIHLLTHIFERSEDDTREIMLDAHKFGVGVCPLYNRIEDAEAKIAVARAQVHQHGHSLELTLLAVV